MRELLVRDLGECINCGGCVEACHTRHGRARLTLNGQVFGRYQLRDVCRHCPDTPCVKACRLDGMRFQDGKTYVSDACRGCSKCAEACPFSRVVLLPRERPKREGLFRRIVSRARSTGNGQNSELSDGRVAADARRCVQCGICSHNCPAGIQVREYAREGKIVDDTRCVKCGLCIQKCPRGTLRWDIQPEAPRPYFRADKCDLCRGYRGSACVKECPTGALARLPADARLKDLSSDLYDETIGRYLTQGEGDRSERAQGTTVAG